MADPITIMAGVGMATSAASGVVGAMGAGQSASANAAMFRYKSGLALMNQRVNKQNASWAREAGDTNAQIQGTKAGQQIGATKVKQAASGLDVNTGSAAQVREDQGKVAQFEQGMIRYDASKTAYGYEVKAASDEAESHMMDAAAVNAEKAGKIGILSSILGGASSVASKWSQGSTAGIWGGKSGGSSTLGQELDYAGS